MALAGLIHTTRLVVEPLHNAVSNSCPEVDISHVLDEGILRKLTQQGSITPEIVQWLTRMVTSAQTAGADIAVVSCSSLSPCVNEVQNNLTIPVIKIDEPMMEYALQHASRIGLLMTNPTTEAPSTQLFEQVKKRLGFSAVLTPCLCPKAFAKLSRGDIDGHDSEVVAAIETLLQDVDVVMLAQISIARVRHKLDSSLSGRVYSSLDFIGNKISSVLEEILS